MATLPMHEVISQINDFRRRILEGERIPPGELAKAIALVRESRSLAVKTADGASKPAAKKPGGKPIDLAALFGGSS